MYKRFIRWASDRLDDDGIIAFITNRAYIDARQDDGFRKVVLDEFTDLYIVDLGGNFQSKARVGNVFGIRIGVAISFLVRHSGHQNTGNLHYYSLEDELTGAEKLAELVNMNLGDIVFEDITPDAKNNWFNQSNSNFEQLMPLVDRQSMRANTDEGDRAVFRLFSLGVSTIEMRGCMTSTPTILKIR